jgi:hypothetical protein
MYNHHTTRTKYNIPWTRLRARIITYDIHRYTLPFTKDTYPDTDNDLITPTHQDKEDGIIEKPRSII